jgi:general secretion pathway protein G
MGNSMISRDITYATALREMRPTTFGAAMRPVVASNKSKRGFTLVEVLAVVAIIAILGMIANASYQSFSKRTVTKTAEVDIFNLQQEIDNFFLDNMRFPNSLNEIGGAPLDPWGNPYRYLNIMTANGNGHLRKDHNLVPINSDYDLYSMGPDGRSVSPLTAAHSRDDIIRANNGKYLGPASAY